jgi:FixJ family two-component response regulator
MTGASGFVFVVDDDPSIRKALARLLPLAGLHAECFSSAVEFLQFRRPNAPSCLILDVQMPDLDGLALQDSLKRGHVSLPIIFISGHGDIPMSVQAMKAGAVDFLPKPFDDDVLLRAIRHAIAQDQLNHDANVDAAGAWERFETLSPREQEVLAWVVSGMLNKQIAGRLGVTEKTIKAHRGQVMRKMKVKSLADLVRMAERLGIERPSRV